tara:strand:+ start:245 stop:838 length:594 start_codon:yes stop_codon:yes gene_type:complete
MSNFLFHQDKEADEEVNIDELFEKSQQRDLKQLAIFNKILNRIHSRIKQTTKGQKKETHIWFTVPEYIFGEPVYNQGDCIGYLVVKLEENGFQVRYVHPNTLFICWNHWIPSYVRDEVKKKTGKIIDHTGTVIRDLKAEKEEQDDDGDMNSKLFNDKSNTNNLQKKKKEYTSVDEYKPTGNLIYNNEMFEKIEKKVG